MAVIFLLIWTIFNGRLTGEVMAVGLVLTAGVYIFCVRYMGYSLQTDLRILRKVFQGIGYGAVLIWETARSNREVSRFVYARHMELEPRLVFFKTDLQTDASRVILANSITLTPGTISVAVNGDEFCVHCLNRHMAEGIENSSVVKLLRRMEEQ